MNLHTVFLTQVHTYSKNRCNMFLKKLQLEVKIKNIIKMFIVDMVKVHEQDEIKRKMKKNLVKYETKDNKVN